MKRLIILLIFITSILNAQIVKEAWRLDNTATNLSPIGQWNILPHSNQLGNLGATGTRWNSLYTDTTITNHLTSSTLSGGVMSGTSLTLGVNGDTVYTNKIYGGAQYYGKNGRDTITINPNGFMGTGTLTQKNGGNYVFQYKNNGSSMFTIDTSGITSIYQGYLRLNGADLWMTNNQTFFIVDTAGVMKSALTKDASDNLIINANSSGATIIRAAGGGNNITINNGDVTIADSLILSSGLRLGNTPLTSTAEKLNYLAFASGTTGTTSTNLVFSTSPALTTPDIGSATGASISLSSASSGSAISNTFTANSADAATIIYNRARGALKVEAGDAILSIAARGYDGGTYRTTGSIRFEVDATTGTADVAGRILFFVTPDGSYTPTERVRINNAGYLGIDTQNPLAKFHDNGTAMFGAGAGASLTDSSFVINYTSGSPVANWYGTDGDTWNLGINTSDHAVFSGATLYSFDNGMTFADPGTSANSYAITLTADNATTPQLAQLYNAYGTSPYIVVAPSNGAGTPTPAIYIHSDAMNFIDSYSLTTNTADDDNVIFKAVDNDDNVLYEVARLTGAVTPTFDLLAGRLTGALNANSQDISSVNALGAVSLTLTGAFTGSSLTDGNDAFTTTATADTVAISGASVNDRYYGNYTTAVTAAESPLSIVATATGFIATRPIGTTSDAAYNWFRIKH